MSRILLVDDEPKVLRALSAALELDYEIVVSESALAAQATIKAGEVFDVIISDQIMPEMKGHELLNWCRQKSPKTKRMMLTGLPITDELLKDIQELDEVGIFKKPWDIGEIKQSLQSIGVDNEQLDDEKTHQKKSSPEKIMLTYEASDHYRNLYSQLESEYFDEVYHYSTHRELLRGIMKHDNATQIVVNIENTDKTDLLLLSEVSRRCPNANLLVTAKPDVIRKLGPLGFKPANGSVLAKPFFLKRLVLLVEQAQVARQRIN